MGDGKKASFVSLCFLDPLDIGNGRELIRDGWPSPPECIGEASIFQNQVQEYVQNLDNLRDRVIAGNQGNSWTVWLSNLADFRDIFVEARKHAGFLAVDFQAATQYRNDIHRAIELF